MSAPSVTDNPLLALGGTVLDSRYELGRVLGAGAMGAVFEARHLRLGRMVAIKVMRPALQGHDEHIQRFLREAQAVSKIRHRNVVEIHDYGEAPGGLLYAVMELLHGQDLDRFLETQAEQRLPWWQAAALLVQAASGLKAAHAVSWAERRDGAIQDQGGELRRAIVADLQAVAQADGVVSEDELGFISAAARTLGIENG